MALTEIKREVNPTLVEILEQALENVKSGETTGLVLLEQKTKLCTWRTSGIKDRFTAAGYLLHAANKTLED